jgi:hypothetical protein
MNKAYSYTAEPDYRRKDGGVSLYPQSWTAILWDQTGKPVKVIEGASTKSQARELGRTEVARQAEA